MDKVGLSGKYQAYPEYKDSGVIELGEVPSGWQVTRIKHSAELTPKKPILNRNRNCSFVPMEKLKTDSITLDEIKPIDEVYDGYTFFLDDDILIAKVTPCFENKNIAIARSLVNGIGFGSSEIYVLRCRANVFIRFLFYRLQEDGFMEIAIGDMTGAGGLKRVPSTTISNYFYAAPSYQEQQKIANFLDHETAKIDTLIEKQQQLIKLLKEKRQAVISHAVTKGLNPNAPMRDSGVEWLGEVPEHWDSLPMKLVVRTRKGVAFKSFDFCDSGIRVVKASDIKQKTIRATDVFLPVEFAQEYSKAILKSGDIILSTVGSNPDVKNSAVGQIGMVPKSLSGTLLNQNTVVFDPDENKVLREYLFYILQMEGYRDHLDLHAHGTANQSSLNINDMLNFDICFPSIKEQHYICEYLASSQRKLSDIEEKAVDSETLLKERRTALISAAVTGKIDVRDWVAPEPSNNKIDASLYGNGVDLNKEASL
jgi:type I restriction enzyme S subunit